MNKKVVLLSVIAFSWLMPVLNIHSPASAQANHELFRSNAAARIGFVPPLDDAAPRRTRSGATRGCNLSEAEGQFTALLPETGIGWTASDQLSLYAHIPANREALQAKLTVKTANDRELYDQYVELPQEGGVLEMVVPESMISLVPGERYTWSLIMVCDESGIGPGSPFIQGDIKRVEPVMTPAQAAEMSLVEQAEMYGEAGLWYDLLSTLSRLQRERPENGQFHDDWASVMRTVGLDDIADQPLAR